MAKCISGCCRPVPAFACLRLIHVDCTWQWWWAIGWPASLQRASWSMRSFFRRLPLPCLWRLSRTLFLQPCGFGNHSIDQYQREPRRQGESILVLAAICFRVVLPPCSCTLQGGLAATFQRLEWPFLHQGGPCNSHQGCFPADITTHGVRSDSSRPGKGHPFPIVAKVPSFESSQQAPGTGAARDCGRVDAACLGSCCRCRGIAARAPLLRPWRR